MTTQIDLELLSTEGFWTIFRLKSFGAEVERKVGPGEFPNKKKVYASLDTPENRMVRVAFPNVASPGTQPENTVTMVTVHDWVAEVVRSLEWTLDDVYNKPQESGKDGW